MADAVRLLIIEQILAPPNEGLAGKFADPNMLVVRGRERTRDEFSDLCAAAGFKLIGVVPAGPRLSVIEAEPVSIRRAPERISGSARSCWRMFSFRRRWLTA